MSSIRQRTGEAVNGSVTPLDSGTPSDSDDISPDTSSTAASVIPPLDTLLPPCTHPREPSLLDVPKPERPHALKYQISRKRRLLHWLEEQDQHYSAMIHSLDLGPLEYVILVPALLFSSYAMPVLIASTVLFTPLRFSLMAVAGCLLLLSMTEKMKKVTSRIRPGLHVVAHRRFNVRSLEKTNAMPSGDSAQCALWTTLACMWLAHVHGWTLFSHAQWIIPMTQFGRVFFGCHWIGDTCVGASMGWAVAHIIFNIAYLACDPRNGYLPSLVCKH